MTMKAALYRRAGPAAEVLQVEEIERPLPGPGEVLVRERAMTAHYCLFSDGPVSGQSVLVAGGAGAVGHFAIELAKRAGARVIATVSSAEKAALAERAGIDCLAWGILGARRCTACRVWRHNYPGEQQCSACDEDWWATPHTSVTVT